MWVLHHTLQARTQATRQIKFFFCFFFFDEPPGYQATHPHMHFLGYILQNIDVSVFTVHIPWNMLTPCRDMRHKLQSGPFVMMLAFLLAIQLLGCCVTVQCANDSDIYSDCETNFTTLENALIHTSDNAYNLWTTFFPPRDAGSLFVVVTYQIINSNSSIDYVWTTASFTLIHPPRVFGIISLFFGLVEEDRIQSVTVQLPESCQGLLTQDYGRNNKEAKSNFLEVVTQRVSIIATLLLLFYR